MPQRHSEDELLTETTNEPCRLQISIGLQTLENTADNDDTIRTNAELYAKYNSTTNRALREVKYLCVEFVHRVWPPATALLHNTS